MTPLEMQVREAIAILENGTEYERLHVAGILRDGLRWTPSDKKHEALRDPKDDMYRCWCGWWAADCFTASHHCADGH